MIEIQRFFLNNALRNYNYFLVAEHQSSLIIDPTEATSSVAYIEQHQLKPEAIWITHEDRDHIGGAEAVSQHYKIPVYAPQAFCHLIDGAKGFAEGDTLSFGGESFAVKRLQGHTPHHHIFYGAEEKLLISGDMLFNYGIGKVRNAQHDKMYQSIQWLAGLPADTVYLTAHDYDLIGLRFALSLEPNNAALHEKLAQLETLSPEQRPLSTIGEQSRYSPYFQLDNPTIISALKEKGMPVDTPFSVFKSIRLLRDNF